MKQLLLILISLCSFSLFCQSAQTTFGKNRVQNKQLEWKYISTENFNIYYYSGGNSLAHNTARHLEKNYDYITHTIGYLPYDRINILVYNCDADLQQSNISLQNSLSAGGETKLIKSKIEVSFKGNQVVYNKELDEQLSNLFINIIMYGGSFRDKVQSTYLIDFPAWFLSGCSAYIGQGESLEMYNTVQDFLLKKRQNPDRLTGKTAKLIGQSMYHYIKTQYGEYAIANILSLSKATRNEETGIRASLGVSYSKFIEDWKTFYINSFEIQHNISKDNRIARSSHTSAITQLKINKSKTKIAYSINKKGVYHVYVKDLITDKKKILFYGGVKDINWQTNEAIPLISWKSDTELSLIKYKQGKPYLITKDINSTFKREKKSFVTFDAILSFDFSPNEKEMVLSGVKKGQSNIYVYNTKTDVAKQITKDLYDDLNPTYSPSGEKILFSSNRLNDTLRKDYGDYKSINNKYNLFEFNGSKTLNRVTNSLFNERQGSYKSENEIIFLSNHKNKNQLYLLKHGENIAQNISTPGKTIYSFVELKNSFLYRIEKNGIDEIHKLPIKEFNTEKGYLAKKIVENTTKKEEIPNDLYINNLLTIDPNKKAYDSDPKGKKTGISETTKPSELTTKISIPKNPIPLYSIDYIVTSTEIDPIRNIGALFEVGTSDMFSNHRINGKLYITPNLKSSKMFAQYELLKYNLDFKANIFKDSHFRLNDFYVERQTRTDITLGVSKPFSPVARLEYNTGTSRTTYIDYINQTDFTEYNTYFKNGLQFIYDNTIERGMNESHGFRLKTGIEYMSKLSGNIAGFNKLYFDARKYQPIFRDLVFATRLSYGRYGGALPRVYALGGVDNWLLSDYEDDPEFDPFYIGGNQENAYLLYSDFATNLRGFSYNKINGNSHILFNAEIRMPIVKMFYSGPVSSSFFRNLQLNAFYETGSAWNGSHPFNSENSINTRSVSTSGQPFSAEVINYQNPFLSSYGLGLRSMLFGYYMKLDVAWGRQNYVTLKPKLHLSLGYDF